MRSNKGFTVFELLIGFVFLIIISYFLLTTMFGIRDRQQLTVIKNNLIDIKNGLTQEIEYDLLKHKFVEKEDCGTGCYDLKFATGLVKRLLIDTTNNTIKYGDTLYTLTTDSSINTPYEVSTSVINNTFMNRSNSLLTINIPIEHSEIKGDYGININQPYDVNQEITPIVITLNGNNPMTIVVGSTYNEPGATATSPTDGDITDKIEITNNVDTSVADTYSVIYEATDSIGAIGATTRSVIVVAAPDPVQFSYTGAVQTYTIPLDGTYKLEVWGGSGGLVSGFTYQGVPGLGGYSKGEITLTSGQVLNIYVGGQGTNRTNASAENTPGGWNGGGDGHCGSWCGTYGGSGGGGATDIRLGGTALANRIIVAGGGGGGYGTGSSSCVSYGGSAGGLNGLDGQNNCTNAPGKGGTQSAGGSGTNLISGTIGIGGSANSSSCGAGGGAGYYGGSSGYISCNSSGGGGGSSFIGTLTNSQTLENNNSGNGRAYISYVIN